jgi:hypothetical protein
MEPEVDSVAISSRDTGGLSSCYRQQQAQERAKTIIAQDFEPASGLGSESDASAFSTKHPEGPSAVLERLKLSDSPNSSERNNQ